MNRWLFSLLWIVSASVGFAATAAGIQSDDGTNRWRTPQSPQQHPAGPAWSDSVPTARQDPAIRELQPLEPLSPPLPDTDAKIQAALEKISGATGAGGAPGAGPQSTPAADDPLKMSAKWNNGLELQTADKNFRVHVGGRYQMDASWYSAESGVQNNINIPYSDGLDFRRARFRIDGTLYKNQEWAAEVDFVNSFKTRNQPVNAVNPGFTDNSVSALTDFWWQFNDLPRLGSLRIGQQKEPIGFEHLVSSRFLPFMERSFNQDTFYGGTFNGFNPGIQAFRTYGPDDNGVVQMGLFKPVNNVFGFGTGDGDYSATGRLTRLLQYCDEGRQLTHVGFSFRQATAVSQAGVPGRIQTFRTRDAIRSGLSADWPIPAGIALYGDDMQWANAEFVMVRGPWTLQSEYMVSLFHDARVNFADAPDGTTTYHGGYVQLFRFLTDDYEHYDKKKGFFERVKPLHPYRMPIDGDESCFGLGAFQVGARYNFLDLDNSGFNGGILHNMTFGVNWFLNPNMKLQGNYIATFRDVADTSSFPAGSGWIHGWGGRIAIDF